tara:strand:+ start:1758 stop:4412 length:2655 start_codon:yes stop_codon:yes gene_type:complete
MLKQITKLFTLSAFVAIISSISLLPANAQSLNLGGFEGNGTAIVTHGFSVRTEDNNCQLVSGSATAATAAQQALIGGGVHTGNGGCNGLIMDPYGNNSSKTISIGSVNGDDGRLNFGKGAIVDAGQTISLSFSGTNAYGIGLNLSGVAMYNPVLAINDADFKRLTNAGESELESSVKLGNAYITAPLSANVDMYLGNYIQSQGVTALLPIGVNNVNSVNLPLLRSPGARLKDALLPQAMIGLSAYSDSGVTVDAYYQLEQKPVELDAAGSFFGSELVGVGSTTGLISSAFYNEDASRPHGSIYYDVAQCIESGIGGLCNNATAGHLWAADEDSNTVQNTLLNVLFPTTGTTGMATLALALTSNVTSNYDAALTGVAETAGVTAALTAAGYGASSAGMTLTNAQVDTAFQRLVSQEPAMGTRAGLLNVFRAPDAEAKDDGQYGVNFSGYLDDVGSGVEWGVYFNNTHANQPRIRMLGITNGYSTDFYLMLQALQTAAGAAVGQTFDISDGAVTANEQLIYGAGFGQAICALLAPGVTGPWANATHYFDPSLCYAAAPGATRTAFLGNATGAIGTLSFANAGRYQLYYPEDIQTFGLSLSTNLGGTAANFEVAYRPDFPLQLDIADLTNNLIDSTGGTILQNILSWAAAGSPMDARAALLGTNKWSATANCDLSSATGNASGEMAGYNECDGTAEMDVWTFDANFATSYTASHPFVTGAGADSGFSLFEIGAVSVPDMDYAQGVVRSGQFQSGYDVNQNGCMDPSGLTNTLVPQANSLFGLGYCEDNAGADSLSMTYRIRTGVTYNNFQNSAWTFSPSFGFDHDFYGDGPSSMGGFVDGRMKASLTAGFTRSDLAVSLGYQMNMGDPKVNGSTDKDIATASFSYAY